MEVTPESVLHRLGGWARTQELHDRGVTRKALQRAVAELRVLRVREGWYVAVGASPELVAAVRHGGVLGCLSAAEVHGLWVPEFAGIHVWMHEGAHRRSHEKCTCVAHWDLPPREEARSVSVEHALAQVAECAGGEAFFVCLESALRHRKLSAKGERWLRLVLPRAMVEIIELARDDADSGIESIVRYRFHCLGISMKSQCEVPGVGRVDYLIGDRLLIEVDGKENHDGPSERHKDLIRDAQAAALGLETLRFDYAMVMYDWNLVEAAVRSRVDHGLHLHRTSQYGASQRS